MVDRLLPCAPWACQDEDGSLRLHLCDEAHEGASIHVHLSPAEADALAASIWQASRLRLPPLHGPGPEAPPREARQRAKRPPGAS